MWFIRFLLSVVLILTLSCTTYYYKANIIGKYSSAKLSRFEQSYFHLIYGVNFFATGEELTLENDSTFTFHTCGNNISGKWQVNQDSIFLFILQNKLRSDSSNLFHNIIRNERPLNQQIIKFQIGDKTLIRIFSTSSGKVFDKLIRDAK